MATRLNFYREKDKSVLQLSFGFNSFVWSSMYWFTIQRVWYEPEAHGLDVVYAKQYFSFLPQKQWRKDNKLFWFAK